MTITLRVEKIRELDKVHPGVIADFGYDGKIVRFEILSASKVVTAPRTVNYEWQDAYNSLKISFARYAAESIRRLNRWKTVQTVCTNGVQGFHSRRIASRIST